MPKAPNSAVSTNLKPYQGPISSAAAAMRAVAPPAVVGAASGAVSDAVSAGCACLVELPRSLHGLKCSGTHGARVDDAVTVLAAGCWLLAAGMLACWHAGMYGALVACLHTEAQAWTGSAWHPKPSFTWLFVVLTLVAELSWSSVHILHASCLDLLLQVCCLRLCAYLQPSPGGCVRPTAIIANSERLMPSAADSHARSEGNMTRMAQPISAPIRCPPEGGGCGRSWRANTRASHRQGKR
jgi:hypothetical protein